MFSWFRWNAKSWISIMVWYNMFCYIIMGTSRGTFSCNSWSFRFRSWIYDMVLPGWPWFGFIIYFMKYKRVISVSGIFVVHWFWNRFCLNWRIIKVRVTRIIFGIKICITWTICNFIVGWPSWIIYWSHW